MADSDEKSSPPRLAEFFVLKSLKVTLRPLGLWLEASGLLFTACRNSRNFSLKADRMLLLILYLSCGNRLLARSASERKDCSFSASAWLNTSSAGESALQALNSNTPLARIKSFRAIKVS